VACISLERAAKRRETLDAGEDIMMEAQSIMKVS
jgi:hypothetical protein